MERLSQIQGQLGQKIYTKVRLEVLADDQIGLLILDSPKDLNALDNLMRSEIAQALREFDQNNDVKVIVILSNLEKAFCAGANIKEFIGTTIEKNIKINDIAEIVLGFKQCKKIVISAVHGVALGGGFELAMLSDFIICSEDARFGLPELRLGLIPGIQGTQRLARLIGRQQALRYITTSDMINAQTALRLGITSDVVKREQLKEEALKLAKKVSEKSLYTLILSKSSVNLADETGLEAGQEYERLSFSLLQGLDAQKEGTKAFVEKRPPNFKKL